MHECRPGERHGLAVSQHPGQSFAAGTLFVDPRVEVGGGGPRGSEVITATPMSELQELNQTAL